MTIGKETQGDPEDHCTNTLNPEFGRMFELSATFPINHKLKIEVLDNDYGSRDDLIGETVIDIENRYYSHHRATCGLAESYSM